MPQISSMEFKQHIVAFADVLGASAASQDPDKAKLFGKRLLVAHKLLAAENGLGSSLLDNISMTFFSDSIVLTAELEADENVARLLNKMALYQALLAVNGLFLRGGIAVGSYLKTETVDFGAPLVQAVHIEKYVSKDSAKICLSEDLSEYGQYFDLNVMADRNDGTVFLDFMGCIRQDIYINRLRARIVENLEEAKQRNDNGEHNDKVIAKLNWLANYFNFQFKRHENIPCKTDEFGNHRFQRNFVG